MPELKRIDATRIVTTPAVLDTIAWPDHIRVLRIASDEALMVPPLADRQFIVEHDPHAIVIDDAGYAGIWLEMDKALAFLERACEWEVPQERPAFAQGAVADIPTKLWLEAEQVLFMVPAPYAADFEERMA